MDQTQTPFQVSGLLTADDVRVLTKAAREADGALGPTTIYYAGVTAPAISAAMGVLTRVVLSDSGMFSAYWVNLTTALFAAIAGIAWYTMFVNLSKRSKPGRAYDMEQDTHIATVEDGLVVQRGHATTTIDWGGLKGLKRAKASTVIFLHDAAPLIVPDGWFDKDKARRDAFISLLRQKADHNAKAPA